MIEYIEQATKFQTIRFEEPPLLGPGAGFPPYGPPEFHQPTDGWKATPGHPAGLMKDPPLTPGRNGQANFVAQGQQQVSILSELKTIFPMVLFSR